MMTYDTLGASKILKYQSISVDHAKAFAEGLNNRMDGFDTKFDIKVEHAKNELRRWMFGGFIAVIGLLVAILLKLV